MNQDQRQQAILDLLAEENTVKTSQLSRHFKISRQTIHSDIEYLDKIGKLTKIYGGATANRSSYEPPMNLRKTQFPKEKKLIGQIASSFVEDNDTIFLDVSTSVTQMIPYLIKRKNLRIVTTSIEAAYILSNYESIELYVVGGLVRSKDLAVSGSPALEALKNRYFDKVFLGVGGVTEKTGFTDFFFDDCQMKRILIANSRYTFALFDASKVGQIAAEKFADIKEIDTVISYGIPDSKLLAAFEKENVDYIDAKEKEE